MYLDPLISFTGTRSKRWQNQCYWCLRRERGGGSLDGHKPTTESRRGLYKHINTGSSRRNIAVHGSEQLKLPIDGQTWSWDLREWFVKFYVCSLASRRVMLKTYTWLTILAIKRWLSPTDTWFTYRGGWVVTHFALARRHPYVHYS
jgi:hypothetical protein